MKITERKLIEAFESLEDYFMELEHNISDDYVRNLLSFGKNDSYTTVCKIRLDMVRSIKKDLGID